MKNSKTFTVKVNDEEIELIVKQPSRHVRDGAHLYGLRLFKKLMNEGAMLRDEVQDTMRERGLWDDKKEARVKELAELIYSGERQLNRGGVTEDGDKFTKEEARQLAVNMRKWRAEQISILANTRKFDEYTVEGSVENAKLDYFVANCVYKEDGELFYTDVDDYLEQADTDYSFEIGGHVAELIYGYDRNAEKEYPENKFLVKYGFARSEDMRLVDENNHLVNERGQRINEDGFLVNEDGNRVDKYGNLLDENGDPIIEFHEFED